MKKEIMAIGKTIELAVENGANELGVSLDTITKRGGGSGLLTGKTK